MGFFTRNFWPLVGGAAAVGILSLVLNAGLPATIAGLLFGGLLMWGEVQRAPAVIEADASSPMDAPGWDGRAPDQGPAA